jgi:hypothetical protein
VDALVRCCAKDCPECYGDCSAASAEMVVMGNEQALDAFVPLVYCDDSGSADGLNRSEGRCQDTVASTLSNFVASKSRCYQRCRAREHRGSIPAGSCNPPASDPATQACITREEARAAAAIDRKCSADNPECYGSAFDTGAKWVNAAEVAVDSGQAATYCGSPSGAFLD